MEASFVKNSLMQKGIKLLFFCMLLVVLWTVLFCFESTSFWLKREYLFSQPVMLWIGLTVISVFCVGISAAKGRKYRHSGWVNLLPWAGLLALELVLCFHAYFITGWDVRGIVETAYALAGGEADLHIGYLSQYPNNVSLVMLFAAIIRVVRILLGNPGMDRCIYVLIAFQCVINTFTGILIQYAARRMTDSARLSWAISIVYMAYIGLSPWLMIPYSDSTALIFPTAILTLYLHRENDRFGKWVWPGIGMLAGIGYLIKPQVLIAAIAIGMVEAARQIAAHKFLVCLKRIGSMALVIGLLAVPGLKLLIEAAPIELRPGRSVNMLHYVMMGLNAETNGSYFYDDVVVTYHAEDKHAAQIAVIQSRLAEMGIKGLGEHLKKKTLTNYADGSFAWGCEGEFYSRWIEYKDEQLSPYLRSIVYTGGSRYKAYQTVLQSIWLALLAGCVLCAWSIGKPRHHKESEDEWCVLMLSIIGITLFQAIFEARARYLYLYAPFYVLMGVGGIWYTIKAVMRRTGIKGS